jgi:ABC-type nitrate/sulfonate/bicarbonate transport system substrate-binding protein
MFRTPPVDRRTFLRASGAAMVAGVAAVALPGCGSSTASTSTGAGLTSLNLQLVYLPNVQFGGSFLADARGFYKAQGLRVTFLPGGTNIAPEPIVTGGRALVGITHTSELAAAMGNGAPLTVVGAGYQKNPFCIISRADAPITTPQALIGKKIGVATTNVPVYQSFLKANNISPSSVQMVTIQFDPTPVATREVDAMIGFYTNEPVQLQLSGTPVHTMLLNDFGLPLMEELYIVRTADLHDPAKRKTIKAFLAAERQGWQACVADPKAAAALAVNTYGKDQKLDLAQQEQEAVKQNDLVSDADTAKHGLFWMTDAKVTATRASLRLGGVEMPASAFSNEVLQEI